MVPRVISILCVDADPDSPEHGGFRYDYPDNLKWKWLPELTDKLGLLRKEVSQKHAIPLRFSWFARADSQIKKIYGDPGWNLKQFRGMWDDLSKAGDELAWHPHSWRWSDSARCWYNETADSEYMLESFSTGFNAFTEVIGREPAACRTGINFHNNRTMAYLEELGVKVDLSCHPGTTISYVKANVGGRIKEGSDWNKSPTSPFHPSRNDYQRPSEGADALRLLEIPMTVYRRTPTSIRYWINLSPIRDINGLTIVRPAVRGWFLPSVWGDRVRFRTALEDVFERAKTQGCAHYASYMHSDDIDDATYQQLANNIEHMITKARASQIELEFVTATEANDILRENMKR